MFCGGAGLRRHLAPVHERLRARLAPQEHVFGDCHVRRESKFLVNRDDAKLVGIMRRGGRDQLASEGDRAGVRRLRPGQDFQKRRLAGSIFTEEGVDLAGRDLEIDIVERQRAGKTLGDAGHSQQRIGHPYMPLTDYGRCARIAVYPPAWESPGIASGGSAQPWPRAFRQVYLSSFSRSAWFKLSLVMAIGVSSVTFWTGFVPSRRKATRALSAPVV